MAGRPRVFTIPASVPFLATLVRAITSGALVPGLSDDPLTLANATLFLPTRRACRLARDAFLDGLGGRAAVLPRILAIGDVDEDEFIFADAATGALAGTALELPPAIPSFERRLLLAKLVQQWAQSPDVKRSGEASLVVSSPSAALTLAGDLARLLDDLTTRQVDWNALDRLVPHELDQYWALTLQFLRIAREHWPNVLAARGAVEAAERRERLIEAEAARLSGSDGPVIAAGSTGSIPVTAKLLATIAKLPNGAVVLPGLDTDLDSESWDQIRGAFPAATRAAPAASHPQFAMHALLERIGISREEVTPLSEPAPHGREAILSEALRPAATTEQWRSRLAEDAFRARLSPGFADLVMIEASNPEEEALSIAIALRETLQTPDTGVALVTPDRALARRVIAALDRWAVPVDDSGGEPLSETPAGVFARLIAEAALNGTPPVTLLALMKHPLFRLGAEPGAHEGAIETLELAVLRGPRPRPGPTGLAHALTTFRRERDSLHRSDPRRRISDSALSAAEALVARLQEVLQPLTNLDASDTPLADLAARHLDTLDRLARDGASRAPLWTGDDGIALEAAFNELTAPRDPDLMLPPRDYADVFTTTIADRVVRRPLIADARVRIYGPLEARLQNVDRAVLGGLIEGVWPPQPRSDPWLSRPMRHDLGLDLPERRIGLSAHDFAQALGAKEVILTRAAKRDGAPTVLSRFVQRLAAVAGKDRWDHACERGRGYVALARSLDKPSSVMAAPAPEPKPPREARPLALSVTDIENLLRDPYTIYAKHILKLEPIDPVDTLPGASDRGSVIHAAIADYATQYTDGLPHDPFAALVDIGRRHFARLEDFPEALAFWWPRFLRIARWFTSWDAERRDTLASTMAEIRGRLEIDLGPRVFRLSAIADRIDSLADGGYAILDYKTGQARSEPQVRTGLAPQLTLEGAILRAGGFAGIASGSSVSEFAYVLLKGGEPAGHVKPIKFKDSTPDAQSDTALRRLTEVLMRFENETEPYRSLVTSMWARRYGDYDHLARIKEWSAAGGGGDEGGEA